MLEELLSPPSTVRKATQHALCEHGYLEFRRGRISTPFASWKAVTKALGTQDHG